MWGRQLVHRHRLKDVLENLLARSSAKAHHLRMEVIVRRQGLDLPEGKLHEPLDRLDTCTIRAWPTTKSWCVAFAS